MAVGTGVAHSSPLSYPEGIRVHQTREKLDFPIWSKIVTSPERVAAGDGGGEECDNVHISSLAQLPKTAQTSRTIE